MSNKVDQKEPKIIDTTIQEVDLVKQHDAGFDQNRYMPNINYVTKFKGARSIEPVGGVEGDTYYNTISLQLFVYVNFIYQGTGIPLRAPATFYTVGDYVDNGGTAYIAIIEQTSGGAFNPDNWRQVTQISKRMPA